MVEKASLEPGDARQDFLRRFFHDFATPLSAISLHLEGADRRIKRGDDPSESLAIARAELSRAFELFERGRECLFAQAGPAETFPFDDFVTSTVRCNGASSIAVEGVTGGRVTGGRRALSDALLAIVNNALEAAAAPSITVRIERLGGRLRARVENPGRLAQDPEALFSPRVAGAGRNWGMGLARARLLAATAGGTVRLDQVADRVAATLELPEEKA